jgi:transposase-like protein
MAAARRSRAEWEQLVREAERIGSVDEVARRHGVRRATLAWWRWQLRRGTVARSATKRSPVHLVPVRVRAEPRESAPVDEVVEVVVRGALIRVRVGQDVGYVAELAAALAARC